MTASYFSILIIFYLITVGYSEDFIDCFTILRNVKATCHKPVQQKTLSSFSQCQEFCLSTSTCKNAQYNLYKNTCEIFEYPSLIGSNLNKTYDFERKVHDDEKSTIKTRSEITCAPALQPSIGTVYFVPREECFEVSKQTAHARYAVLRQLDGANDKNKPPLRDPFSSIAVEVLPIVPDCPLGEKARVQIIDGVEVISSSAVPVSFKVESAAKCVHACITSTFSDASRLPLLCRSAHFNRLSTKCSIYSDAINPNGYLEYRPNSNVLYMEKLCISEMILPLSCDEVFRRIPQHILLGHASDIITSTSEEECIRECIAAKVNRGIQCQSLLHYPDEPVENCILNVHSKLTRPKYFIPELEHKVDYVEIPDCAKNLVNEDLDTMNSEGRVIDRNKNWGFPPGLGIVEYEWSEWTDCDRQTSTQRRERLCSDCIERIQIQPCFSNFDQQLTTIIDDQEKVGPPAIPPHSNSIEAQSILPLIPFPERSAMNSLTFNKNKTMNVEFFGPAFDDLGAAWKSTFKTT